MLNPMDLTGRRVMVTGASSGIGRETSILLSQLGAQVILVARDIERLESTSALLEGNVHHIVPFDLRMIDEIPHWLKSVTSTTGPLYGLVHSAGMHITRPLKLTKNDLVDDLMKINFMAALNLVKGFNQKGVHLSPASVVFLSSVVGSVGQPGISAYAASKGALNALTKSLALELAGNGIRINSVAPGTVYTEMTENLQKSLTSEQFADVEAMHPLGIGSPRDVAHSIAFLLADTARWITGSTLTVDGGYTAH